MSFDSLTRRGALMGAGGLALASCTKAQVRHEPLPVPPGPFKHGVASGDPDQTSLVVWTAVTEPIEGEPVMLELAGDAAFSTIVHSEALAPAGPAADSPATGRAVPYKALVTGLQAGTAYHYRFRHAGEVSPAGATRTLPEGPVERFNIAAFSCSNYPAGFFNAYRAAADRDDVDLVVHLGDYIYEYAMGGYGTDRAERLSRLPDPMHEIVTVEDYARRHALYCLDPDLQALKAKAPWIAVWDDHETANDAHRTGAENHDFGEGNWTDRRDAALEAYYAWLPARRPEPAEARYGAVRIGDLATLLLVETRLLARTESLDWSSFPVAPGADPDDPAIARAVERWLAETVGDERRELLGAAQLSFVGDMLARSRAAGQPWRVFVNQVLMGRKTMPDYTTQTPLWLRLALRFKGGQVWETAQRSRFGVPMTLDDWDGFPAERERLYEAAKRADADFLVLTGDSHNFWCNDLHDASGERRGTEFGVTSVTSPSEFEYVNAPGVDFGQMTVDANPEVLRHEVYKKGYVHLALTREAAEAEFVAVSTIESREFTTSTDSRWRVAASTGGPANPVERLA